MILFIRFNPIYVIVKCFFHLMSYCEHFPLKLYLLYSSNSKNPVLIEQMWVLERKLEVVGKTDWRETSYYSVPANKGMSQGKGWRAEWVRLGCGECARERSSGVRVLKAPLNLAITKLLVMLVKTI